MNIDKLIEQISGGLDDEAYKASDLLAENGSEAVVDEMIKLLDHSSDESKIVASRTLGLIDHNEKALEPLLAAIDRYPAIAGDLMMALEGFDISAKYVVLFKYSLSDSFKVSTVAQDLLDHKEFDITPRVIKKITKAWNHYEHNVKQDEVFDLKKKEIEETLKSLNSFLEKE